jgi:hypothetical protein
MTSRASAEVLEAFVEAVNGKEIEITEENAEGLSHSMTQQVTQSQDTPRIQVPEELTHDSLFACLVLLIRSIVNAYHFHCSL